jgi:N-acyl-D-amino-acid deacylase
MHDLVIRSATIIDGNGQPGVRGDVAVDGDTISEVGRVASTDAHRTIDADGLTLAPGFIDMHAHSDLALLDDPEHRLKTRMGVTTELLGQDGLAYAPGTTEAIVGMRDLIAGINGAPDIDYDWTTVAGYLGRIEAARPAVNAATLVPHGTLRLSVMGMADRVATADERRQMAEMADGGMRDGALGLSTGLTYPPAQWSDTQEITDICRAIAPYAGIYVTHHRDYGAGLIGSVDEALAIGLAAGVAVHFSHFHVSGKPWKGRAPEVLAQLIAARAAGQDVTLDAYPYLAGSSFLGAYLPDSVQGRSPDEMVVALRRPDVRAAVVAELDRGPKQFVHVEWSDIAISNLGNSPGQGVVGRRLTEIAATRGVTVGELICDLLIENEMKVGMIAHVGNEDNVRTVMADPNYTVGTDSILVGDSIHPRAGGTYPRILGTYVRESGVLPLETAVRAMSGAPAARLGLVDRGTIEQGKKADLVLFDDTTVAGPASYDDPWLPPIGMPYVFVNGEPVKWDDEMTGARPGRVIRGDGKGSAR